jgi:hypothetical protein
MPAATVPCFVLPITLVTKHIHDESHKLDSESSKPRLVLRRECGSEDPAETQSKRLQYHYGLVVSPSNTLYEDGGSYLISPI